MTTLYDIETGRFTETSQAAADLAQARNPGRYMYTEDAEEIDINDISILGIDLAIGGTD
jgi:hypothetical protein